MKLSIRSPLPKLITVLILLVAATASMYWWKLAYRAQVSSAATAITCERHKEKWAFLYRPRPGEKPNSEGRALAADATGIYVTGLVQTHKEDTDMLTLKLSNDGKLLWADRYSSPEHDCDRAFSVCLDNGGGLFVAGETYVPEHSGDPEGWHFTLLHYTGSGKRLWIRRSPMISGKEGHCIQVCSDNNGGCYLGGTQLSNNKDSVAILRYDASGKLAWTATVLEGARTVLNKMVVGRQGDLYLCGTTRRNQKSSYVNDDWLIARIGSEGNELWRRTEDGPTHGADSACDIAVDQGGSMLVAGMLQVNGSRTDKGAGYSMAVQKFGADGARLWRRIVPNTRPSVTLQGLSVNVLSDVVIAGTERLQNGNTDTVMVRYDTFGNQTQWLRCPIPAGYKSATLLAPILLGSDVTWLTGQIFPANGDGVVNISSAYATLCNSDGTVQRQLLFDSAPGTSNLVRDVCVHPNVVMTGQTGASSGPRSLMVVHF